MASVFDLSLPILLLVCFSAVGICVLLLFAQGTILKSTGENGWKILIPFYGQYLLYKRTSDAAPWSFRPLCIPRSRNSSTLSRRCWVTALCWHP